jgi:preprotein translocase subunit SecD
MELLAKVPFFRDGHKASGLSPDRLDVAPRYRGAGQFSGPRTAVADAPVADAVDPERELVTAQSVSQAPRVAEDGRRMTIAERRAAERKAAAEAAQNEEKH